MQTDTPKIDRVYTGVVADVDHSGYTIRLTEFKRHYEGLIHKSLIDQEASKKLVRGRYCKVKLIALLDDFIVINLESVEEKIMSENKSKDERNESNNRVIRISSPERYQVKQMSGTAHSYVNVERRSEPLYFQMMSLNINTSSTLGGLFSSVVTMPSGFMLTNAVMSRTQEFQDFKKFLVDSKMDTDWILGDKMIDNDDDCSQQTSDNPTLVWESKKSASIIKKQREMLPIFKVRNELIRAVTENSFLIVQGETGSGKSTQIPQYLLEAGFARNGKIVCTQPRKLATMSLAKRVAEEQGCALGDVVGYKYRFCDKTSCATLIKYCTEGTLLRECLNASHLNSYSVIILDEAHERTTNTDVLFGYLKKEMKQRPNLKVIVSSATLEAKKFAKFFGDAKIFNIKGRTFPVEILYRRVNIPDYFNAALATTIYIHMTQKPGDILLFFTGQDEIEYACEILENHHRLIQDLVVLPIFSALQYSEQVKVFNSVPVGHRKLVISTNVSETSMTIPGIFYVIDAGYTKLNMYDPKTGLEVLQILPISQASADQRAGRAGRTGPGQCYRLYTKDSYDKMLKTTIPEIQRSNLASVVLQFKAMGINDVSNFEFMDSPSKEVLLMSEKQLYWLNAIDCNGHITETGRKMVDLPLEPNLSKMLITSVVLKCSDEIITIIAMMSVQNVFYRPRRRSALADSKKSAMQSPISDLITLLNVYNTWKENSYSSSWCHENFVNERSLNEAYETRMLLLEKMDANRLEIFSCGKNLERVQKAICAGLAKNIAKKNAKGYKYQTIYDSGEAFIHPSSGLMKNAPQWITYYSMTETKKKYLRDVTIIDPMWLVELEQSVYNVKK